MGGTLLNVQPLVGILAEMDAFVHQNVVWCSFKLCGEEDGS